MRKVLTIAGSDSGGGAGIQADLKTMTALGVFGMSAITALTAQNTVGVAGIFPVSPEFLSLQIETVMDDLAPDAVKTGMLFSSALIEVTALKMRHYRVGKLVVDPVMVSKSGHRLLEQEAVQALVRDLLPLALVVTPNIPEAEILAGRSIKSLEEMEEAARRIRDLGPACVIIKGGHLSAGASDVLYDGTVLVLAGERLPGRTVHGTGCTFSAALASYLALGRPLPEAAAAAKKFVTRAIAAAVPMGLGHPPVNLLSMGDQEWKK